MQADGLAAQRWSPCSTSYNGPAAARRRAARPARTPGGRGAVRVRAEQQPQQPPGLPDDGGGPPNAAARALALLTKYGGIRGTTAVAIGAATGIDPFGGFHFDDSSLQLALLLAAPLMVIDAAMMLPDWRGMQQAREGPVGEPGAAAAAVASALAGTPALAATLPVLAPAGGPGPAFPPDVAVRALAAFQGHRIASNAGRGLPAAVEAGTLLVLHLAEEMLWRAVSLTLGAGWIADRLAEGGLLYDDPRLPEWLSMAAIGAGYLLLKRRALLAPPRIEVIAQRPSRNAAAAKAMGLAPPKREVVVVTDQIMGDKKTPTKAEAGGAGAGADAAAGAAGAASDSGAAGGGGGGALPSLDPALVARIRALTDGALTAVRLDAVRGLMEAGLLSVSWILSHNLFVPWAVAVSTDLLFSGYQRLGDGRLSARREAAARRLQARLALLEEMAAATTSGKAAAEVRAETIAELIESSSSSSKTAGGTSAGAADVAGSGTGAGGAGTASAADAPPGGTAELSAAERAAAIARIEDSLSTELANKIVASLERRVESLADRLPLEGGADVEAKPPEGDEPGGPPAPPAA